MNHSGLTGRKNAVDTYGEYARHSGKALSGKDPMRIDRIGVYAARYAAKNVVAAGLADEKGRTFYELVFKRHPHPGGADLVFTKSPTNGFW